MKSYEFDGNWTKRYKFDAFKGLQNRQGPYSSANSDEKSDGTISLIINDDVSDNPEPYPEQINAINYLIRHPEKIHQALINGVDSIYDQLKSDYGFDESDTYSLQQFPEIKSLKDYNNTFGVSNVYVYLSQQNGMAYIGIECGCT